jgi:hypothetical protein
MAADTFPDRVTRITAREKSRSILASEDRQRVSKETPNQSLGSSALLPPLPYPFIRKIVGPREKESHQEIDGAHLAAAEGWVGTGNVYAQGRKDSDAADGKPEKVT